MSKLDETEVSKVSKVSSKVSNKGVKARKN